MKRPWWPGVPAESTKKEKDIKVYDEIGLTLAPMENDSGPL